ncbi:MAG: phosphate signaling complex protein PhoU [Planctomycetota bacterium]|nr:MAG: phosphate signaling complex protein PhoU [Planctomycetota bacterium]
MTKHLRNDLERLERDLLTEGALVEEAVRKAIQALLERRPELARDVIDGDRIIDLREVEIEEECLKVLALHQPVATDLRFIAACLKINNDLERVGDLAVNIAERAASLATTTPIPQPKQLRSMMEQTTRMLRESLDAFVNEDGERARAVCLEDDQVDRYNREVILETVDNMKRSPESIDRLVQFVSISRNLERIADHATNIAEDVLYVVKGEIVRHRVRSKPGPSPVPRTSSR